MKMLIAPIAISVAVVACGGADTPTTTPAAVAPDGTQVPLQTDDGELEEGETEVEVTSPDGSEKEVEVEVDD